jgi:Flp pilus assembly pilin Flp
MLALYVALKNWFVREEGQDLVEYAMLIVLIALALVAVIPGVSNALKNVFNNIAAQIR